MTLCSRKFLNFFRLTFSEDHPIKFGYIFPSEQTPFYQEPGTRYSHIVVDKVGSERNVLGKNLTVLYMLTGRLMQHNLVIFILNLILLFL